MSIAPGPGHNAPRPLTASEVTAWLTETCEDMTRRRDEIIAGIDRFLEKFPTITDEDTQRKASDFAGQKGAIAGFLTTTEARRKGEKQPFLDAERSVDGFFKSLSDAVASGREKIRGRMTEYAVKLEKERREAARIEAEAAAKRAADAAAEAEKTLTPEKLETAADLAAVAERAEARAEASPAELSRVHGTMGSVSSLRTNWRFDEATSDLGRLVEAVATGKAPLWYLSFNTTRINYAVRSEKVRTIPGCAIIEERKV